MVGSYEIEPSDNLCKIHAVQCTLNFCKDLKINVAMYNSFCFISILQLHHQMSQAG